MQGPRHVHNVLQTVFIWSEAGHLCWHKHSVTLVQTDGSVQLPSKLDCFTQANCSPSLRTRVRKFPIYCPLYPGFTS